jgi:putative glutamine transport system ATP-binding protein
MNSWWLPQNSGNSRQRRQVADRVVFMADGQIIEEGTPDHFFENPSNERVKQFLGKIIR